MINNATYIKFRKALKDYKSVVLKPFRKSRQGWGAAFRSMHAEGDDQLLIPDVFDVESSEVITQPTSQ